MKRIVIIDDDPLVTSTYGSRFKAEGCEVASAADAEVGLKLISEFKPDAILLDLILPGISGIEAIKLLRSTPEASVTPIFAITNTYNRKAADEAIAVGANQCLLKASCTPRLVCDSILGFLARKARQDAAASISKPAAAGDIASSSIQQILTPNLDELRQEFQVFFKERRTHTSGTHLVKLRSVSRIIGKQAALAGGRQISQLASGLELLFQELADKPKSLTPSTIHTATQGIDVLVDLVRSFHFDTEGPSSLPPHILAVDDDTICCNLLSYAMERAGLNIVTLKSPLQALDITANNHFDLIFLDVTMPEMSGYELCAKIRQLENYQHTPIIFVTGLSDFQNRVQSTASGGTDFISKPFVMVELLVKSLIHLSKGALRTASQEPPPVLPS